MLRSTQRARAASTARLQGSAVRPASAEWVGEQPAHVYKEAGAQLVLRPARAQMVPTVGRLVLELIALVAVVRYAFQHHWNLPWWLPLAIVAILFARAAWVWLGLKTDCAIVDQARITFRRGVLNRASASVEFSRIQNVLAYQAWWQRPFGIGTVLIQTTDRATKSWTIGGVDRPHEMRERVLRAALATRHYHGTSEALIGAL
ncbi:PH domain-containing protein [Burkholderia cenocepacia]|uniref:PH domain-containing protein n=1 Tax=Burkholderia cenocepacia TaxID=95486 RepID=UPI002AB772E3|nr:PH domain-containing protein [Burkholderia cenocepacia]